MTYVFLPVRESSSHRKKQNMIFHVSSFPMKPLYSYLSTEGCKRKTGVNLTANNLSTILLIYKGAGDLGDSTELVPLACDSISKKLLTWLMAQRLCTRLFFIHSNTGENRDKIISD